MIMCPSRLLLEFKLKADDENYKITERKCVHKYKRARRRLQRHNNNKKKSILCVCGWEKKKTMTAAAGREGVKRTLGFWAF